MKVLKEKLLDFFQKIYNAQIIADAFNKKSKIILALQMILCMNRFIFRQPCYRVFLLTVSCCMYDNRYNSGFAEKYLELKTNLSCMSDNTMTYGTWYRLRGFYNVVTLFEAGRICRDKTKLIIKKQNTSSYDMKEALFFINIEDGEYDKAKNLLKTLDSSKCKGVMGIFEKKDLNEKQNEDFSRYLREHKVLIVGPAPQTEEEKRLDCDKYKILSFNYNGKRDVWPAPKLCFYNGDNTEKIFSDEETANIICETLEYVLVKNRVPEDSFIDWEKTVVCETGFLGLYASINALPCVIFTLAKYGGNPPFVVGNNLYAGQLYRREYINAYNHHNSMGQYVARDSERHDPIAQFLFLKRAYEIGLFETTKEFEEILLLSEEDYVRRLEQNYWSM